MFVVETLSGSNNLQVVFDPVNLLSLDNYGEHESVISESLELFGDRIAVIHAKDFGVEQGQFKSTGVGLGKLRYDLVVKFAVEQKPGIGMLLEDPNEQAARESRKFLQEVADGWSVE